MEQRLGLSTVVCPWFNILNRMKLDQDVWLDVFKLSETICKYVTRELLPGLVLG